MKLTFKRVYKYGGDCKADDTDYICGYQASNGVIIKRRYMMGVSAWVVGDDTYKTLEGAKSAVIRKANEEPAAAQEAANDEPAKEETKMKKFEVGKLYSATGSDGIAVMKVIERTETAVTFEWFGHTLETEEIGYDSGAEYISPALIRFFADNERLPQDVGAIDTRMSVAFDADGASSEIEAAADNKAAAMTAQEVTARKLYARAHELRNRAEGLNYEGKLDDSFVRSIERLEVAAYRAAAHESAMRAAAKNPRVAAAMERLRAKQAATDGGEAEDSGAGQPAPQEPDATPEPVSAASGAPDGAETETVELHDDIDTYAVCEKNGIAWTRVNADTLAIRADDYRKLLDGAKNKRYIRNLRRDSNTGRFCGGAFTLAGTIAE